jgi:hypothetical protein
MAAALETVHPATKNKIARWATRQRVALLFYDDEPHPSAPVLVRRCIDSVLPFGLFPYIHTDAISTPNG